MGTAITDMDIRNTTLDDRYPRSWSIGGRVWIVICESVDIANAYDLRAS